MTCTSPGVNNPSHPSARWALDTAGTFWPTSQIRCAEAALALAAMGGAPAPGAGARRSAASWFTEGNPATSIASAGGGGGNKEIARPDER